VPHEGPVRLSSLDSLGATAAATCGLHCLVVPPLLAALPLTSFQVIADPRVEWSLLAISMTLGIVSLVPAYVRCHRCPSALMYFGVGALLLIGTYAGVDDDSAARAWLAASGGLCVCISHRRNARLCCVWGAGQPTARAAIGQRARATS
jgi:hypothetical protein